VDVKAIGQVRAVVQSLERVRREANEAPAEVLAVLAEARGEGPAALDVIHPVTGEAVDLAGSTDALVEVLARLRAEAAGLRAMTTALEDELVRRAPTPEKSRTVYLEGAASRVQVVHQAPVVYGQTALKTLWESHPAARAWLKVAEIGVDAKAWDAKRRTNGEPDFEAAKAAMLAAEKPNTQRPRVVIMEGKSDEA